MTNAGIVYNPFMFEFYIMHGVLVLQTRDAKWKVES